ncbi:uncharacterized protein [Narcine bancroftii]|uniref:uncharacterized protein n=1 Tax=Narcine bancroftii TaxID=1343680 RepID=UPI0038313AE8
MCTREKQRLLYALAFTALISQRNSPIAYFHLIKSYVGGAQTEDLKYLANNKVNMDFSTFRRLDPEEVKKLSADNLINLLGFHLHALQSGANETVVRVWVASNSEADVKKLGLTGGIPNNTSEPDIDNKPINTTVNETMLCRAIDSSALKTFLLNISVSQLCFFNITDYACAETDLLASRLSSDNLVELFNCFTGPNALNRSDESALTIFVRKLNRTTLTEALDKFNNQFPNRSSVPLMTKVTFMNALWETVKTFENLTSVTFLRKWFQERFRPFIAGISQFVLKPLQTRNITCDGYQAIVKGLSNGFREMQQKTREIVLNVWILNYLDTTGSGCIRNTNGSRDWLLKNWGMFSALVQIDMLTRRNPDFNPLDAAELLTPSQLADFAGQNGTLRNAEDVRKLFNSITTDTVVQFIERFNTARRENNVSFTPDVRATLLQEILNRTQPILSKANNTELQVWFDRRLQDLLPGLTESTLPLIFVTENCEGLQIIISALSTVKEQLNRSVQEDAYEAILVNSKAFPLQCYENNSFIEYLKSYFQNYFNFLTLKDAVSLIPPRRETEVLNSIDLNELANLLSTPGFVDDQDILTKVVLRIQPLQNLTRFLDAFANATRDRNLLAAVLEGVWIWFTEGLPELTDAEVDEWLNVRLAPYLPFITTRLLVSNRTLSVSCLPYRRIVKALNAIYPKLSSEKRTEIYNGIRTYLLQGPRPKCYNASDPVLNSTAWFSQYLGLYLSQVPLSDLQSFSDDETLLQEFAANPKTLEFLENVTLMVEVATAYINLLAKNNPNFNASTVPNSLLCFIANTNLLQNLTAQQTLALIGRINNVCGRNDTTNTSTDGTLPPEQPTDEQIKLAIVLVSKIDNFSVSTLNTLGQNAIGLSSSQVDSIDENTLQQALPTLGNVQGWNIGQANSIVNKLLRSGYQVNNRSGLLAVGTLVSGIPSDVFERINPTVFINLISNVRFVQNIGQASQSIRAICVLQVLRNVNNPVATVKNIPSVLASEVPPVLLNSNLSLDDVNNKEWTPSQSAVFFPNVIRNDTNFETFSPTVLQGFSCGATKTLSFPTFLKLVQELKLKEVSLDESQLDCVAGRLSSNGTEVNLNTLPSGVLLFNYQYFRTLSTCREFFKSVGKSNRKILSKVLARERDVLKDARTCLGVTNSKNLTKETLTVLSGLVCELDGSTIMASDISVLDELKKCVTYRDDQKRAIEYRLQSGSSKYGFPSSWSSSTIRSLGYLPLALTDTWKQINKPTLYEALPRFIKKIKRSRPPGEVLIFISQLQLRGISNNTATCTEGEIAPEDISDLTPAIYRASQLDLCLSDAVLKDGVLQLGSLAFDPAQLKVLKKKLLRIYPKGLPENQIQLLGNISTVFNATEVSSWNITRVETLSALMKQQLDNITVMVIITQFLQSGGKLEAVSLKGIGGANLCTLNQEQLKTISNLTDAGALDLSMCTREKQRLLYALAFTALISQRNSPIAYFHLIKSYVGGAQTEDLKYLANNKVNMDFSTFRRLDPEEVKKLSADNLINLLGFHLHALQSGANETVVRVWVASNSEADVKKLGLTGGIPNNTSEPDIDNKPINTTVNETMLCRAIDSSALKTFLLNISVSQLCFFNITDYACAETDLLASRLSSDNLVELFNCFTGPNALNRSDESALTIFVRKLNRTTLTEALDKFNNQFPNRSSVPLMTKVTFMNALWETVKTFENLTSVTFLRKWFQERFRPFIAGISQFVLKPLQTRNITCDGYQAIVKGLSNGFREMQQKTREIVLNVWILNYLDTTGSGCIRNTNGSRDWLLKNWGMFSALVQIDMLTRRNPDFNPLDAAELLTPSQLADFAGQNGTLRNAEDVRKLFNSITTDTVVQFIERFNTARRENNVSFTPDVRATLLQEILNRTQPILSKANNTELQVWFDRRLQDLLPGLTESTLPLIFVTENCEGLQIIISALSTVKEQLNRSVQEDAYEAILVNSKAFPLQCYENNSFIEYLKSYFQNYFNFLTLKDAVSLIPPRRETEVLNSIDLNELANLLSTPGFVDDQDILTKVVLRIQPLQNLTRFLDAFANATRDRNLLAAVLEGVWIWFTEGLPELTDAEVDEWLNVRLAPYLPFITTRLLVSNRTLSVSCLPYRRIVKALNAIYPKLSSEKRSEIYNGIRTYLLQGPRPKCYNASDPVLNSTAWFSQYLGLYLSQVPLSDLQSFSDDETLLQEFAANPKTLEFLENVTLMVEVATAYINLLAKNNPNFNASTVPNSLLCFIANTNLLQNLTAQQTLALIGRINNVCGRNDTTNTSTDGTLPPEQPTDEQIKLAIVLVSKIDNFSVSTLNTLGQNAIGLSSSQVDSIDENTLQQALPTLGNVQGWNIGQANSIVNKLLRSGYQVNNRSGLLAVGTLVSGIPSDVFERINPTVFINLISNVRFVQNIGQASQSIRAICVLQVLRNVNNPVATVKTIPSVLASEVPPVLLNSNLSLDDVNNKEWTPSQSAVFFPNVIRNDTNFETFSPTVLQGFSCGATKTLSFPTFLKLVQELKLKEVSLDESQLDCVAGRLSSNGTEVNLNTLPSGVLLFNYQYFRTLSTCREFFKSVGKSNRKILSKVLARERDVLKDARTCLGVTNSKNLTKETLTVLSGLVCELDGSTIMASDISVLDELKKCVTYRDDQKRAIEYRLQSGSSKYGFPSSWSSSTIRSLGYLPLALTDTWKQINKPTLYEALPRFIKKIKRSRPPGEVLIFISQLQLRGISNNTATCTEGEIAPEDISDLTPAIYRASQLDLCLSDAVLKDGVLQLGSLAFDPAQLKVLKKKLLRIYPKGLPENQIQLLGNISTVFNATEVSSWNITRVETLSALMKQQLDNITVTVIITQFLQSGGKLEAVSLKGIGGANLCTLNQEQLKTISNLTDAGALDLSMCTREKQRLLYALAFTALISQRNSPIAYFHLIKSYVGGAQTEDLKYLANNKVNMDFSTFRRLDPEEVKKLSADNLINLLGFHLHALQSGANETVVRVWVASNSEADVKKLGLTGGIPNNTSEPDIDNKPINTTVNETMLCRAIDSSALKTFLLNISVSQLCFFNITDYACAETDLLASRLSSDNLVELFNCFTGPNALNRSDESALTIFVRKLNRTTLTEALDKFNNQFPNRSSVPLMTKVTFMNALWETVKTFENLTSVTFLRKWFQERFRPFIAGISQFVLKPLQTRNITCDGYQAIVKGLSNGFREMQQKTREIVLNVWILNYLDTTGSGCIRNTNGSRDWLLKNWGMFSALVQIDMLTRRNPDFNPLDAAELLTPSQLADFAGQNGTLRNAEDVRKLFNSITTDTVVQFIERFNTARRENNVSFTPDVRATLLQEILNRTQPILSKANNTELQVWFDRRLQDLLPGLTESTLPLIFVTENCEGLQIIISALSTVKEQLNRSVQEDAYEAILVNSKAFPLQCYENNSFIEYLKSYFQNYFNFLTLKDAVSLIPPRRETEVLNSIDLNELANLLSTPGFIDDQDILTKVVLRIQPLQNLTRFLDAFANATRDRNLLAAVLEGVWIWFTEGLPELTDAEVDEWLNVRLAPYLPFITTRLLVSNRTLSVSCLPYRRIVKALNAIYPKLSSEKRTEIYNGIRTYLLQGPRPKCYNASDPVLNSTAWFSQYLGLYLSQVPLSDLQSFSDDETLLQEFAANPKTLEFLENVTLMVEVATAYINLLAKNNPNFNASTVPNSLLCFIANTNLLQNLTAQQTLALIGRINNVCGRNDTTNTSTDGTLPPEQPTDEQIKLAIVLVSKIDNFSVSTLNTLGQNAIGLSSSQVDSIDENTLQQALPTLGNVQGWNIGQANSIVNKLLRSGYQVNNRSGLLAVGTLVSGIPSDVFERINPTVFINLISNVRFVQNIGQASQSIRAICVLQVLRNVNNPVATVKTIPSVLASEVPPVLLNSNLSLDDVNNKEWTPSQSAVFFPNVIRNDTNFETFSPTVLQGFSCGATKTLSFPTFLKLVQELKLKEVSLDESQLDCVAGRLSSNGTEVNLNTLPSGVLLFNYQYFRTLSTCREFFKSVGKSNRKILSKVLARERDVLKDARTCLGVTNSKNLTKETLTVLSGLVCELDGSTIMASDISVLDELKKCVTYRDDQKRAIEYRLQSGSSKYGFPSSWSSSTIRSLGYLPLALTDTWKQINKPTLYEALPRFIKKIKRSRPPGEVLIFISQLQLRGISNNTATCTEGEIAPEDISDLTPAIYRASQLDLCLSDAVLKDGVLQLGSLAFDPAQLKVLKKKLLRIYPKGLPENQIQLLGNISTVFNATEVSSWNITRVETLSALMKQQLDNITVTVIITQFLQSGGKLEAVSLKGIGGANLCTLNQEQLKTISNLTDAGALDLSMCTREKQRLLYALAFTALISQRNSPIAYFHLIKSYVGGAQTEDLKYLANNKVNMDFSTFRRLDPEEVKKLSADNLINLLGFHLHALQSGANETVVRVWVASNSEADVKKLGLTGGIPNNTSEPDIDNKPINTTVNETMLCRAIDSSALKTFLLNISVSQLCFFNITDYACAETDLLASRLSSDNLVELFNCFTGPNALNRSDESALTIFVRKLNRTTLTEALDKFNNQFPNRSSVPLMTKITFMNALWETVKTFENLTSVTFLRKWFQERFRPFIAGISQFVLKPLQTRNITCDGYQAIVKGLSNGFREMQQKTREIVLNLWILNYLDTTGSGCIRNTNGSRDWLLKNWGMFSALVQIEMLTRRNPDFNPLDAVELLTPSQLADFASQNGTLRNAEDVRKLFNSITTDTVVQFIERFNTARRENNVTFTPDVRTTLLQEILNRTQPILSKANNTELQVWFIRRLQALLPGLTENTLPLIFVSTNCEGLQIIISALSTIKEELNRNVQEDVYEAILVNTKALPLSCYENNSFGLYLNSQLQNFSEFLTLSDVAFLADSIQINEVLKATTPSDLADLLSRPGFLNDNNFLTMVLLNYQPIQNLAEFVDRFNQETRDGNLTDANQAAIMKGLWSQFVENLPGLNRTEQDEWLNSRLSPYLPSITFDLLTSNNTLSVPCLPYRKIVKTLSRRYNDFSSDKQIEIYRGIRAYLQQGPKPKCYNATDPVLNSTAWFAEYLGRFMNQVSAADLQNFAPESNLQDFAADSENKALLNNLTLPVAVSKLYISLLLNNNPAINVSGIPDSLICFIGDTNLIQDVNQEQALTLIEKVNQICENSSATADDQISLTRSLLSNVDNFSASTLTNLQQAAVGLSVTQIKNTDPVSVQQSLPSLSNVRGWELSQSKEIVAKLSSADFKFNTKNDLISLGTLVPGISINTFESIRSTVLANLTSEITFVRNIQEAPQATQQTIILKVLETEIDPIKGVNKIPSELVKEIPLPLLTANLNLEDVNDKQWEPSQAAVFFESIVIKNKNFKTFSTSVLQGTSCGVIVTLNDSSFLQLVETVKEKRVMLDESQLSCLSHRVTSNGTPSNIDTYPDDLLLFFNSTDFRKSPNCKKFFKAIGRSNIDILRKGSTQRQNLLNDVFTCLGIAGGNLTRDDVAVLGHLNCDLPGSIISNCDVTILDHLSQCTSYSDDQKNAIEFLLNNRDTRYGSPVFWSTDILGKLGNLPLALTTTWKQVNPFAFNAALPAFIRKIRKFNRPPAVVKFLKQLRKQRRRITRALGCTIQPLTAGNINELTPVTYDATQLEACLSDDVLKDNVETLGALDFDTDQLEVLKNKLNLIYPNGLSENQIQLLGNISTVFNVTEVSSWNITQIETLSALMAQELESTTVKTIITKYLQSGGTLNAVSLKAIGGSNLCTLNETQLMTISGLTNAGTLDISSCTQSKKNLLYTLAQNELASQPNNTIAYFNLIKPFLGGANAKDLREFANNSINMDFATFTSLNPEEVVKLTAKELQGLLGINIPALQTGANETVVVAWVNSHFESNVREVGLTGGIPDPPSGPQLNFMCGNNIYNDTDFCADANSSTVNDFLMSVNESHLCDFNITDYACTQNNNLLEDLTSGYLMTLFNCYTSTKALQSQDETALGIFLQKLDKTVLNEALDKFNNKTQNTASIPLMSKITFMNALWENVKTNENLINPTFLTKWFQERFRPFNAGISQAVLNCLLIRNTTCEGYQAVLKGLNNAFGEMLQATRKTVLKVWVLGYLNSTGKGCISNTNGSRDWLLTNWGRFRYLVNIEDFASLNSNFNGFDALDILNPKQLSELTVSSLNNMNNINEILDEIAGRNFSGLKEYMNEFVINTQKMDIQVIQNTSIRNVMLNRIMQQLEAQFPAFNAVDYANWFQTNLLLLLPSIGSSNLALIPTNISCESNQAIIKGLDNVFPSLSSSQIRDVNTFVSNYLSIRLNSTGNACTVNAPESRDWILKNFGKFRSLSQYSKLISLNSNFMGIEVVDLLSVRQLAQLSASNGILNSSFNVQKIMNRISADNITQFMDVFSHNAQQNNISLTPEVAPVLLNEVLNRANQIIANANEAELEIWLDTRLQLLIPEINGNLTESLLANRSCRGAQIIIRTLNAHISKFPKDIQRELYNSIRNYLIAGPKTRCYNASDPALNSTAWFANYFGKFLIYTSTDDLALLTDEETLKLFSNDPSNLNLLMNIDLPNEIQTLYANALFTNAAINFTSIPDSLVCFIVGTPSVQSLNTQQALNLLEKSNDACLSLSTNATVPSDDQMQLAVALVSKIDNFSSDTLINLGQSAVGLSITQINTLNNNDVVRALSSLGMAKGWTPGKVNALVAKLNSGNFQFNNASNLLKMGTLVSGLPSDTVKSIGSNMINSVISNEAFAENILLASEPSKQLVVEKVIQSSNDPKIFIQRIPANLASKIPLPQLISEEINLHLVNEKQWNPSQAAVFFGTVIRNSTLNFNDASPFVLQGFSCAAGNNMSQDQFEKYVEAIKDNVSLSSDQLICIFRKLNASGTPRKISDLPADVLIFYTPEAFPSENCTSFFGVVGNVREQESQVRKNLLKNAKLCLNISDEGLSRNDVKILKNLVCEYDGDITKADVSILEPLKNCAEYTAAQQNGINTLLNNGTHIYGNPSTWNTSTLENLGTLVFAVNRSTWNKVNRAVVLDGLRPYVRSQSVFQIERKRDLLQKVAVMARRSKRTTGCTVGEITASMTFDAVLPAQYEVSELESCLNNNILKDYLFQLGGHAFSKEQLQVLKQKLNQIYPNGIPEEKIQLLGFITSVYNSTDINTWNVTKLETLSAALQKSPSDDVSKAILSRYLNASEIIDTSVLNIIGGRVLCLLDESKLESIRPTYISNADPLNISSCSQSKKNLIYNKVNGVIELQNVDSSTYYNQINAYVGGAKSVDLQNLSSRNISMDSSVFLELNPNELEKLSAKELKELLGINLQTVKDNENTTLVQNWISKHTRNDVLSLGIGLKGGKPNPKPSGIINITGIESSSPINKNCLQCIIHSFSISVIIIVLQMWW